MSKQSNSTCTGRFFAPAIFALLLFCAPSPSLAQGREDDRQATTTSGVSAQGGEAARPPQSGAAALFARLGLTPEQVAQIRLIRQETEHEGQPLARRMRQARRALDQAIYSDNADDALIETRAREFAQAQGEVTRLRALAELRVRRVLTPDQLGTLRELRRQARLDQMQQRRDGAPRPPRINLRDPLDSRRPQATPTGGPDADAAWQPPPQEPSLNPRRPRGGGGAFRRRQRP